MASLPHRGTSFPNFSHERPPALSRRSQFPPALRSAGAFLRAFRLSGGDKYRTAACGGTDSGHRDLRPGASVNLRTSRIASPALFFALSVAAAAISLGPFIPGLLARAVSSANALAAEPAAAGSASVLVADKGKLRIMIKGQLAGRED